MQKWYTNTTELFQQILIVEGIANPKFDEVVEIAMPGERKLTGRVLEASRDKAVIQVFSPTDGLEKSQLRVRFTGKPLEFGVGSGLLGRVFDGLGQVIDRGFNLVRVELRPVNGLPINPSARDMPADFIQTGISAIDVLSPLVRGQKLPIFSAAGLPHSQLAAQIVRNAHIQDDENFVVVFGAIGITHAESEFFIRDFKRSGALSRTVMFLNLASDPVVERLALPRVALTAAEYLAYDLHKHVLVVLTDMTNYCNALREISAARQEVPGRRGYPGYMYTDLASIYERAGRIRDSEGSLTQIPILTMPDGDTTHPIPDLTGYITEGQIILSQHLAREGVTPPIDVLASLSRLKDKGIGEGKTDLDHDDLLGILFAAYAKGQELQDLSRVLGLDALSDSDRLYLEFNSEFERKFISQGWFTNRSVQQSLDLGWQLAHALPESELAKVAAEVWNRHPLNTKIETSN